MACLVYSVLRRLLELGAELHYVDDSARLSPRLWRNTIIDDPGVDVFIVRDSDSRLTPRDAAVVSHWLRQRPETAAIFHCIRDHPHQSRYTLNAGLWGARRDLLSRHFNGRLVSTLQRCLSSLN